jgi:hypothetical protein
MYFFLLQVKSKAARKITFEQFITALRLVASTKVGRVPRVRIPDVLTCYTQSRSILAAQRTLTTLW